MIKALRISRINREILNLSIPNILSNISIPLLSSVDVALMGNIGELELGAVGLGSMIFNFIYWNFGFLRMGTTGQTAQSFGRGDRAAISTHLYQGLLVAIGLAALVIILQKPFLSISSELLHVRQGQEALVSTYFSIRIWAAPATLALYVFFGWFFGLQNAVYPLVLTILVNLVNIVGSFYLVNNQGLGIAGVAWGTVIAQYAGVLGALAMSLFRYRRSVDKINWPYLWQWRHYRQFVSLNLNIFIRTICLTFAFGFFYSRSSRFGTEILAVNTVLLQFANWMSYGIDGFAFAAESLIGKYYGAGNRVMLKRAFNYSFAWAFGLAGLVALIYGIWGSGLFAIFSDQADLLAAGKEYLPWMVVLPLVGFASYIWDGVFIGLTAGRAMRNTMVLSLMVYLGIYSVLEKQYENHGLWTAFVVFLVARAAFQWYVFYKRGFNLK